MKRKICGYLPYSCLCIMEMISKGDVKLGVMADKNLGLQSQGLKTVT